MSLLTMSIPQNDMLGRRPQYDYQTNGTMMRDIVTTAHRLYAKVSIPDISSIPIQANKARQIMGVSFDLNDTVVKNGRVLNPRRNTPFI